MCVWVGISGHKRSLCPCLVAIERSVCVFEREVESGVERNRQTEGERACLPGSTLSLYELRAHLLASDSMTPADTKEIA